MLILFIDFKSLLVSTSFVLSHRFLRLPSCRHLLLCVQAKATNNVIDFAQRGDVAGVQKCITDGANVDEYKDKVREKKNPKINVRNTHVPQEWVPMTSGLQVRVPMSSD